MPSDLQQLQNIGPKMESHLQVIGVGSIAEFMALGAVETTRKLLSQGVITPHVMYFHALCAAEQERGIFSFDRAEKAELKAMYADILAEVGIN